MGRVRVFFRPKMHAPDNCGYSPTLSGFSPKRCVLPSPLPTRNIRVIHIEERIGMNPDAKERRRFPHKKTFGTSLIRPRGGLVRPLALLSPMPSLLHSPLRSQDSVCSDKEKSLPKSSYGYFVDHWGGDQKGEGDTQRHARGDKSDLILYLFFVL